MRGVQGCCSSTRREKDTQNLSSGVWSCCFQQQDEETRFSRAFIEYASSEVACRLGNLAT